MHSDTQEVIEDSAGSHAEFSNVYPRAFELFEEFSGKSISKAIRICRENSESFDSETRRKSEDEVEGKVDNFYSWLQEVKGFHPRVAYYHSVSLKSLLLGLPIGVAIGLYFGIILDRHIRKLPKET